MSPIVTKVILFAVMVMISLSVTLFFTGYSNIVARELLQPQVEEVAQYVGDEIKNLATLILVSDSEILIKELDIPPDIQSRGYVLSIYVENGSVYLSIKLKSFPWNEARILIGAYSISHPTTNYYYRDGWRIEFLDSIDSGYAGLSNYKIVVWAYRDKNNNSSICIGLGLGEKV
ncbi:MAG: hypothetical protein DRJ32_03300 [Thermoprotei archaeon]|nr:MAG: hypothetical protein DRJ32_03300 [Thermoprotei archaeon]